MKERVIMCFFCLVADIFFITCSISGYGGLVGSFKNIKSYCIKI